MSCEVGGRGLGHAAESWVIDGSAGVHLVRRWIEWDLGEVRQYGLDQCNTETAASSLVPPKTF